MHSLSWTLREQNIETSGMSYTLVLTLLIACLVHAGLFYLPEHSAQDSSQQPNEEEPKTIVVSMLSPPPIPETPPRQRIDKTPKTKAPSPVKDPAPIPKDIDKAPQAQNDEIQEEPSPVAMPSTAPETPPQHAISPHVLDHYLAQVKKQIQKQKRYPSAARRRRLQGAVELSFRWSAKGDLLSHSIKTSSGQKVLDQAAVGMLKRAIPLPPAPAALEQKQYHASLPVNFSFN